MLNRGEAKLLITDTEFAPTVEAALKQLDRKIEVIDIVDPPARVGKRWVRRITTVIAGRVATSSGSILPTNGRRSRSTTRRNDPAIPKAWSITIADISCGCRTSSTGHAPATRCTCGRCDGSLHGCASRGPWLPTRAPTSACGASEAKLILDAIRDTASRLLRRTIVHAMLINAPDEWKQGIRQKVSCLGRQQRRRRSVIGACSVWA